MVTFLPAAMRRLRPNMPFVTQFENESGLTAVRPPVGIKSRLPKKLLCLMAGPKRLHPTYGSLLRDSSRIIALSQRHLESFERAHPGVTSKSEVIPAPPLLRIASDGKSGTARQRGRTMLGLSEMDFVLAYFGYVYSMKGMETLLAAFGNLPSNTRLLVIGQAEDGYLKQLQEASRLAGGADRVMWLGHCDAEELSASLFLSAADMCVLPFNDGVRLNNSSFAVAASHGLPIVTTRGESLEAPFLDGENVRLCPPKDPVALAAAIAELIRSPQTRSRLAAGALKLAENQFSWDRVVASTLRVLRGSAAPLPGAGANPAISANG